MAKPVRVFAVPRIHLAEVNLDHPSDPPEVAFGFAYGLKFSPCRRAPLGGR
jgi:hypothetical protein